MTFVLNTEKSQLREILGFIAGTRNDVNIVINLQGKKLQDEAGNPTGINGELIEDHLDPMKRESEEITPGKKIFELTTEDLELIEREMGESSSST